MVDGESKSFVCNNYIRFVKICCVEFLLLGFDLLKQRLAARYMLYSRESTTWLVIYDLFGYHITRSPPNEVRPVKDGLKRISWW